MMNLPCNEQVNNYTVCLYAFTCFYELGPIMYVYLYFLSEQDDNYAVPELSQHAPILVANSEAELREVQSIFFPIILTLSVMIIILIKSNYNNNIECITLPLHLYAPERKFVHSLFNFTCLTFFSAEF